MDVSYQVVERYELTCPACQGGGCVACRQGLVPVYVITKGHSKAMCGILGHHMIGHTERAETMQDLPRIAWCTRCEKQQIHTDVPEAYDLEDRHTA
jgi:hypothetical protein